MIPDYSGSVLFHNRRRTMSKKKMWAYGIVGTLATIQAWDILTWLL